jgi:Na+(H+)/acetate symporter ActP
MKLGGFETNSIAWTGLIRRVILISSSLLYTPLFICSQSSEEHEEFSAHQPVTKEKKRAVRRETMNQNRVRRVQKNKGGAISFINYRLKVLAENQEIKEQ